jgi:hypothetical protein
MRTTRLLLLAAVMVLLVPAPWAWTQSPQPPGGGGDSRGAGRPDSGQLFDRMSGGKDVVNRDALDPGMQRLFDRFARRMGLTGTTMTRRQFQAYLQQRAAARDNGTPDVARGNGPRGGTDGLAESWFRRLDQNGDGLLNNDEMPQSLRIERDKWDANRDGFIDLNEYRVYFRTRLQQLQAERAAAGGARGSESRPAEATGSKPPVYHAGKLPPGIPDWFAQLDRDADGQIGLYEWKDSGRPLHEFEAMDRNGDGFLTIDEVMHAVAARGSPGAGTSEASTSGTGRPTPGSGVTPDRRSRGEDGQRSNWGRRPDRRSRDGRGGDAGQQRPRR